MTKYRVNDKIRKLEENVFDIRTEEDVNNFMDQFDEILRDLDCFVEYTFYYRKNKNAGYGPDEKIIDDLSKKIPGKIEEYAYMIAKGETKYISDIIDLLSYYITLEDVYVEKSNKKPSKESNENKNGKKKRRGYWILDYRFHGYNFYDPSGPVPIFVPYWRWVPLDDD